MRRQWLLLAAVFILTGIGVGRGLNGEDSQPPPKPSPSPPDKEQIIYDQAEAAAQEAKRKAVADAEKKFRKDMRLAKIEYLFKLNRAFKEAMLAGNLEDANRIDIERKRVQMESKAIDLPGRTNEPSVKRENVTNSLSMKFVWIPPGNFMMGSPRDEQERSPEEIQHKVTLSKGFYMSIHPVTQEQWQALMGNNPSWFKGEKNLPVENVSWDDCQRFIKKLREKEPSPFSGERIAVAAGLAGFPLTDGPFQAVIALIVGRAEKDERSYRLPSEAEWEYACRGGTKTPFYCGETISTEQANYDGNFTYSNGKKGEYRGKTTPVGSFPANEFGLFDMHGNVWQWCQDWYGDYPQIEVVDPQGEENGIGRVLRGGSWIDGPEDCRSACRYSYEVGYRGAHCGFRLCFFPD